MTDEERRKIAREWAYDFVGKWVTPFAEDAAKDQAVDEITRALADEYRRGMERAACVAELQADIATPINVADTIRAAMAS